MQREEKQLDSTLEAIILRVNDLKSSIGSMIFKLEHEYETINWPTFLDNFALISGHVSECLDLLCFPNRVKTVDSDNLLRMTMPSFEHCLLSL